MLRYQDFRGMQKKKNYALALLNPAIVLVRSGSLHAQCIPLTPMRYQYVNQSQVHLMKIGFWGVHFIIYEIHRLTSRFFRCRMNITMRYRSHQGRFMVENISC